MLTADWTAACLWRCTLVVFSCQVFLVLCCSHFRVLYILMLIWSQPLLTSLGYKGWAGYVLHRQINRWDWIVKRINLVAIAQVPYNTCHRAILHFLLSAPTIFSNLHNNRSAIRSNLRLRVLLVDIQACMDGTTDLLISGRPVLQPSANYVCVCGDDK